MKAIHSTSQALCQLHQSRRPTLTATSVTQCSLRVERVMSTWRQQRASCLPLALSRAIAWMRYWTQSTLRQTAIQLLCFPSLTNFSKLLSPLAVCAHVARLPWGKHHASMMVDGEICRYVCMCVCVHDVTHWAQLFLVWNYIWPLCQPLYVSCAAVTVAAVSREQLPRTGVRRVQCHSHVCVLHTHTHGMLCTACKRVN